MIFYTRKTKYYCPVCDELMDNVEDVYYCRHRTMLFFLYGLNNDVKAYCKGGYELRCFKDKIELFKHSKKENWKPSSINFKFSINGYNYINNGEYLLSIDYDKRITSIKEVSLIIKKMKTLVTFK